MKTNQMNHHYRITYTPEERIWRAEDRIRRKQEKENIKIKKQNLKRELNVLEFMLKNDVKYLHHGKIDSFSDTIKKQIQKLKKKEIYEEYNSYVWNYQGDGNNYMSLCLMGNLWRHSEFKTIYDVPLDDTYCFHVYDSGQRGLGSFNHITAKKVNKNVIAPYVNPGAIIPITIK